MPKPLTDLERRVLDYLVEYLRQNTYQPSIREIGRRFDIKSTKTVSELLQSLADKGWIERDPSRSRGVRLLGLEMKPETITVPVMGGAGAAAATEGALGSLELDRRIAGGAGTFLIAMNDDSMAGDGIRAGDLLLVEPMCAADVDDGDLVVARFEQGLSVVRLLRREGDTLLQHSGTPGVTVRVRGTTPEVLGRALSIVRRLRVPALMGAAPGGVTRAAP